MVQHLAFTIDILNLNYTFRHWNSHYFFTRMYPDHCGRNRVWSAKEAIYSIRDELLSPQIHRWILYFCKLTIKMLWTGTTFIETDKWMLVSHSRSIFLHKMTHPRWNWNPKPSIPNTLWFEPPWSDIFYPTILNIGCIGLHIFVCKVYSWFILSLVAMEYVTSTATSNT